MIQDVPSSEWKRFFDDMSKSRIDWNTKIEILNDSIGDQVLAERLPLSGITYEGKKAAGCVEINVGFDEENHQTHTVWNPEKVYYSCEGDADPGVLEIVELDGTKTMIHLLEPLPLSIRVARSHSMARPLSRKL
ncbi:MAG: DUF5335 family protein [Pyrinomonadaceae bacterium]|nr:DUF5335 family protein [Pyrinomonadaceae bacterium]